MMIKMRRKEGARIMIIIQNWTIYLGMYFLHTIFMKDFKWVSELVIIVILVSNVFWNNDTLRFCNNFFVYQLDYKSFQAIIFNNILKTYDIFNSVVEINRYRITHISLKKSFYLKIFDILFGYESKQM